MFTKALLTIQEVDYRQLISLLDKKAKIEFLYTNIVDKPYGKKQLQISSEQHEAIIDALMDLIASKGITNGEINNFGLNIEGLIDRLGNDF